MPFDFAPGHDQPIITDGFAGGGGASTGIEMALGRSPDIAIDHDAQALAMHAANHPQALHLSKNIWQIDPLDVIGRRNVGLAWFSPDCKHFSKAKGGKPVQKDIRDLAWIVVLWAKRVQPDIIMVENVEEFKGWCPLDENNQPDFTRKGETFQKWVRELRRLGYKIEWKELRACDYGAPTIRKRLFVIARRDGRPIIWPLPSHGAPGNKDGLPHWRTAAEIIDWSLPCPSIFDTSQGIKEKHGLRAIRPLADNTLKRIARGVMRYVIEARDPFFINYGQHGGANRSAFAPFQTVTASKKDQNAVVVPHVMTMRNSKKPFTAIDEPMHTVTAGGAYPHLVTGFLAQHNTGVTGHDVRKPVSTLTSRGTQQQLVAAHMINMKGSQRSARACTQPVATQRAGASHAGVIAAFLQKYYGTGASVPIGRPAPTVTTRDRYGLVTVNIGGADYAITDIGMRMLTPRERFRAQGFSDDYVIDQTGDGKPITITAQGRMCGNSVCPPIVNALVRANAAHLAATAIAA